MRSKADRMVARLYAFAGPAGYTASTVSILRSLLLVAVLAGGTSFAQTGQPATRPGTDPEVPLTLEQAVQLAAERNERARAADEDVRAAEARVWLARSFFFPDLTVSGTYTRRMRQNVRTVGGEQVVLQRHDALGAVASLRMTLLDVRGFPLLAQASRSAEAARFLAIEEKRTLSFETAAAFIQVLSLDQVHEAAVKRLEFARRNLSDAEARFEAKLVGRNDVTQARLEQSTAEREAARTKGELATAYLNLGYLLSVEIASPLAIPAGLLDAAVGELPAPETLVASSVERRPDVQALQKTADAARAFAHEPMLRHLPSLEVTGQYRVTNEGGLTGNFDDGFVALGLTWNLFDGGARYAEHSERWAEARSVALDARALERRVGVDVRAAIASLSAEQAALEQAQVAVQAARENADETATLYREGLAAALQVSDANTRLFEAEVALAQARYGLALSYLDLRAAQGLDALGKEAAR